MVTQKSHGTPITIASAVSEGVVHLSHHMKSYTRTDKQTRYRFLYPRVI